MMRCKISQTQLESALALLIFLFMILHPAYLGLREAVDLTPILLFSLPVVVVFIFGFWISRKNFINGLLLTTLFFVTAIKFFRLNSNLGNGGDRDDHVFGMAQAVLNGDAHFPVMTFRNMPATAGPTSTVLSLPFVYFWNNVDVVSWLFLLMLLYYFFRRSQREDQGPWLGLSLGFLVFFPYLNWSYWESSEELMFGWAFLVPATVMIARTQKDGPQGSFRVSIGAGLLAGLAVGVRIAYVIPFLYLLLVLFFERRWKSAWIVGLSSIASFILISLPVVLRSSVEEYLFNWLIPVWLKYKNNGIGQSLVNIGAVTLVALCSKRWKWDIRLGVIVTSAVGLLLVGFFFIKWEFYFWFLPILIWLPELVPWLRTEQIRGVG